MAGVEHDCTQLRDVHDVERRCSAPRHDIFMVRATRYRTLDRGVALSGKMPGSQEDRSVIIAAAEIWRIDNNLCLDQVFELDCISNDLAAGPPPTHRKRQCRR